MRSLSSRILSQSCLVSMAYRMYLGMDAPSPIRFYYPWSGQYTPFEAQRITAEFEVLEVKRLELPDDKVFVNLDRYGNSSAATIPMAVDEARRSGRVGPGSVVAMAAFGSGITYGAAVLRL